MINIPGFSLQNIILVVASYLLVLMINKKTRSDSAIMLLAIVTFHHVVAYLYAFHISLPENEVDPASFLRQAEQCMQQDDCGYLGYYLYVNYLSKMLEYGGSLYFVFLMNVIYFVISLYFFIGIKEQLGLEGSKKVSLLLYGMWPSVIYFTTLHYREPFELYFLIAGIYFGLTGSKEDSFFKLLASMILLFLMGVLHIKGLLFLSILIFFILSTYKFTISTRGAAKRISLLLLMTIAVYFSYSTYMKNGAFSTSVNQFTSWVSSISDKASTDSEKINVPEDKKQKRIYTDKTESKQAIEESKRGPAREPVIKAESEHSFIDKMISKIMAYRFILLNEREVRTAFISKIYDKNIAIFMLTFFIVYLEYLFSPFIFQINTFHELIAYAESVVRLVLFASALVVLKRNPQTRILFMIYLAITSMWAIGVVSFGAGIRHHIQTNWILVMLGVPAIAEYIRIKTSLRKAGNDKVSA